MTAFRNMAAFLLGAAPAAFIPLPAAAQDGAAISLIYDASIPPAPPAKQAAVVICSKRFCGQAELRSATVFDACDVRTGILYNPNDEILYIDPRDRDAPKITAQNLVGSVPADKLVNLSRNERTGEWRMQSFAGGFIGLESFSEQERRNIAKCRQSMRLSS